MLKCDYCKKRIDAPHNIVQLDIVWWFEGEGVDNKRTCLGEFHPECADKFKKKLKNKIKEIKNGK